MHPIVLHKADKCRKSSTFATLKSVLSPPKLLDFLAPKKRHRGQDRNSNDHLQDHQVLIPGDESLGPAADGRFQILMIPRVTANHAKSSPP